MSGQLGLEKTPEEYVEKMVAGFREVKRVLRDDGTLWLNLGDSYNGSGGEHKDGSGQSGIGAKDRGRVGAGIGQKNVGTLKPKDLVGIPWMVAFALRADGWYLRQDIIWSKPNPMPESVTDRCTKSHEYIFLLTKSARYYYDNEAISEPLTDSSIMRLIQDVESQKGSDRIPFKTNGNMKAVCHKSACTPGQTPHGKALKRMYGDGDPIYQTRNKRSVWSVTTQPYKEAHFATFPQEIPRTCILAGSKKGDTILDPFCGSGTTGEVALKLDRNFIGIELNQKYVNDLIIPRLDNVDPLFRQSEGRVDECQ